MRTSGLFRLTQVPFTGILLLTLLACAFPGKAQQQKHKTIRVEVISNSDTDRVFIDTSYVDDALFNKLDFDKMPIDLDSLMKAHERDMKKAFKVMAFKMDSLNEMNFDFDFEDICGEEMERFHIEMERAMKERGEEFNELDKMPKHPHHFYWYSDSDRVVQNVDVQTIVKDAENAKVITKTIVIDEDGEKDNKREKKYIVTSNVAHPETDFSAHCTAVKIVPIPLDDVTVLRKAGIDKNILLNEPFQVDQIKLTVDAELKDGEEQTFITIEMNVPEANNYELKVIDKAGNLKEHDKKLKGGVLKKEFKVEKNNEPYYLMLLRKNQMFGRKIEI